MRNSLEPGLLRLFLWFTAIRFALLLLTVLSVTGENPPDPPQFPRAGFVLFGLLLVLLAVPWLQNALGRFFLPLAITMATVAPIVDAAATVAGRIELGYGPNEAMGEYWIPFFLLFVPFLITAWQYRYRWVLVFAIGSTLLDMAIIGTILEPTNAALTVVGALLFARGFLFAFLGLFITKLVAKQREAREVLRQQAVATERIATARERNRLAREIHDTLAHSMTATAVQLEAVRSLWDDDPARARTMLDEALDRTRSGLGEARRAIAELRATPLEDLGLEGALSWMVDEADQTTGATVRFSCNDDLGAVSRDLELTLFRIASESLNNALRHGDPDNVDVSLRMTNEIVQLTITDDGSGFQPNDDTTDHYGITGMNERAGLVGGTLEVNTGVGDGTTVQLTVPLTSS